MQDERIRLLLVEDNPGDARLVCDMLRREPDFQVHSVDRLSAALEQVDAADLILLDLNLPDSQGLDTLAQIHTPKPALPVIVLAGLDDGALALQAVRAGAQDCLVKGHFDEYSLPRAIRYAIERKRAEQAIRVQLVETERQVERLAAVHTIDRAISNSLDLDLTLNILLNQVTSQLNVDAADVLLLRSGLNMLEFIAGRGFRSQRITRSLLSLGQGYAGTAVLERRRIDLPVLEEAAPPFDRSDLIAGEAFFAYFALPLIAKGQVKGVMEIFHRAGLDPNPEWLDLLETFGEQAAIAIDNAELYTGLQRSNLNLQLAFDATIEGWSRALDLRYKETEGHTLRVTKLTVRLARAMDIGEDQIVHIHRGALLHDIGKLGVPDRILHNHSGLTDEEWDIMRRHPQFAFDMFSPTEYLRPALDIPYCHHEKWNGSGYPRQLKGKQIPLAARLFAVVDVWEALTHERPYRPAWPTDKALAYIRDQSSRHFDPEVVTAFTHLMATANR